MPPVIDKNKRKRIKTYHGVPVPPWRFEPIKKSMTMVFVVTGSIPSKKNELIGVVDRLDAFKYLKSIKGDLVHKKDCVTMLFKTFARVKNAPKYEDWEKKTVELFSKQGLHYVKAIHKNNLIFPVSKANIIVKFYWKGKYRRDNSNKVEGIHDALVKANIIFDDCGSCIPNTSQHSKDYTDIVTESMAVIYVTVPIK